MAPSDSRSVNRYGHGPLACKFTINVTVPPGDYATFNSNHSRDGTGRKVGGFFVPGSLPYQREPFTSLV